jgi:hypothetical protein
MVSASASSVKSNLPVVLPMAKDAAAPLAGENPREGAYDLAKEEGPERASVYDVNPGPPATLEDTILLTYVEMPTPPARAAERGRASK